MKTPLNSMNSAQTIHDWIRNYNWDDGFAQIWPIVVKGSTHSLVRSSTSKTNYAMG
jgi:hypothetical protein